MRVMVLTAGTKSLFWFRMDMLKSLVAAGHDAIAVGSGPESRWAGEFAKAGVRYRQMLVERTGTNPLRDLETIASIRALLREEAPDLLFTFHGKGNIYGNIAARIEGLDRVYSSVEGLGNVLGPRPSGERERRLVRAILKEEYRLAFRSVSKVFFVNEENRDFFVDGRIVAREKTVLTDGIGVNLQRFAPRSLPEGDPVFLFSGRMIEEKGVLVFAQAARLVRDLYPDTRMRCVAIGPFDGAADGLKERLRPYIDSGCFEYAGSHHDVRPYLEMSSAVVLPSFYNEGLPKCLMEGMAVGRAVITTDTVGCRETVIPGANGWLVPPHDAPALAACLIELARNRELARKMGEVSRGIAEERFDVRDVNRRLFDEMGIPHTL